MSKNIEIDFGEGNGSNELNDYLIKRESQSSNGFTSFFSNVGSNVNKYLPRRTGTGSIEDDISVRFGMFGLGGNNTQEPQNQGLGKYCKCFELSRKERIIGFFIFLVFGLVFFTISSFYIPVLIFKARKFSIFFTLGSVFTFTGMSILWGFQSFIRHLFSSERLVFTLMYFGSLFLTLYFAIGLQNTVLTVIGIIFQIISLLSFVVSYLPGGVTGLKYLATLITSSVSRTLPI